MIDKNNSGFISFICLLLCGLMVILAILYLPKSQEITPLPQKISGVWHSGKLPVGFPVVGLWLVNSEIVCEPCIQTDFAGIYEYSQMANPVRQLTQPDYWIDMPVRNP